MLAIPAAPANRFMLKADLSAAASSRISDPTVRVFATTTFLPAPAAAILAIISLCSAIVK